MPATGKIERFELQNRTMELSIGRTTYEISRILTDELQAKGLNDQISQPTVSRFLRAVREARAEETRNQVQEHIKEHVPVDLKALEEIEAWLLDRFRGRVDLTDFITDKVNLAVPRDKLLSVPQIRELAQEMASIIDGDNKTRAAFGMQAARIVEMKLKFAGILENPEQARTSSADPIDLDELMKNSETARNDNLHAH